MLRTFSCSCWPFVCLLWKKCLFRCSTIFQMRCFLDIEVYEIFIYFNWPLIGYIICKYLLTFSRLPCHFVGNFFHCAKTFQFHVVPFFYFYVFAWGDVSKKYCWDRCQRGHCQLLLLGVLYFQFLCLSLQSIFSLFFYLMLSSGPVSFFCGSCKFSSFIYSFIYLGPFSFSLDESG